MNRKRPAGGGGVAGSRAEPGVAAVRRMAGPADELVGANRAVSVNGAAGRGIDPRAAAGQGTPMPLSAAEAHLWFARPAVFTDPAQLARLRALLTGGECVRTDRYRRARDRLASLVTRALVRVTLSRYSGVPPARWRFRTNEHGRPEIASPASPLRFNVSHTAGLVVCLVSRGRELGVDAEGLGQERRWLDLADRFFAPAEARALRGVPAAGRPRRFLEYWTLKEAYVKARGRGLTLPLSGFWFDLPAPTPDDIGVRCTPAVDDEPARWQFTLRRLGTGHLVATAIDRTGVARVRIAHYEAVAGRDDGSCGPLQVAGRMGLDPGSDGGGGGEFAA